MAPWVSQWGKDLGCSYHTIAIPARRSQGKMMAWEQMETQINRDCNEEAVGKEFWGVPGQKVVMRGGNQALNSRNNTAVDGEKF